MGWVNPAILEPVKVPYYGTPVPVSQVANITVPDPSLIVIAPWEPAMTAEIDRAIRKVDLGLNPVSDGKILKVWIFRVLPSLTG